MSAELSPAEMRKWITARLDPLDGHADGGGPMHSDFDMNPTFRPAGGAPLRAAAVLAPLVEHADGLTVLLTRRADTLRQHTGQIAFPGGRCDPGETPAQTALREAQEEIGLDPAHVTLAGLLTPYETVTGYLVTPVVGFVKPGFTLTINAGEVAEAFEAPFSFLMDAANHQRQSREAPGGAGRRYFYAMPYEDYFIWGATAGMLRGLYERLYGGVIA
jgi:8-oxo-dGTP pyrophosphatase MutT (NUDIX family)